MLREARDRFPGLTFESSTRHVGFGLVIEEARVRDVAAEAEAAAAAEADDAALAAETDARAEAQREAERCHAVRRRRQRRNTPDVGRARHGASPGRADGLARAGSTSLCRPCR